MYVVLQLIHQVEQVQQQAQLEQHQYDHLIKWLDYAQDILQIVDKPVHDRQKEYKVRIGLLFSQTNKCSSPMENILLMHGV